MGGIWLGDSRAGISGLAIGYSGGEVNNALKATFKCYPSVNYSFNDLVAVLFPGNEHYIANKTGLIGNELKVGDNSLLCQLMQEPFNDLNRVKGPLWYSNQFKIESIKHLLPQPRYLATRPREKAGHTRAGDAQLLGQLPLRDAALLQPLLRRGL